MELINIALIQASHQGTPDANWEYTKQKIRDSVKSGAQVVVLQELFLEEYFCYVENDSFRKKAIRPDSPYLKDAQKVAKELSVVLFFSFYEAANNNKFNSVQCIDASGEVLGVYRKSHIPEDPGYHEKYYFNNGDTGVQVFQTRYGRIAPLICFDQWFPEAARIAALKGAQLIVYPTAIGWDEGASESLKKEELDAWLTIQRSHAIANGVYVAAVNRVGEENGKLFWGNSFVCGPLGGVLVSGGLKEEILMAQMDYSLIEETRKVWTFHRDRRPELYGGISNEGL